MQAISWVLDHSRSEGATRCVLIAIANHAGNDGEGWAYVEQVCREANCSHITYRRALRWALDNGELERGVNCGTARKAATNRRPNQFRFVALGGSDCTPQESSVGGSDCAPLNLMPPSDCTPPDPLNLSTPEAVRGDQIDTPEPLKLLEPSVGAVISRPSGFDEFWSAYPRRVGKRAARKAWGEAKKRAPVEDILVGAQRLADERNGHDPQYTPHPSTWLNRDGWDDEPDSTGPIMSKQAHVIDAWDRT